MKHRILVGLFAGAAVAGCQQDSQSLPFDVDGGSETVKTVGTTAPVRITTGGGASVQFPAGSVASSTSISFASVSAPAAVQQSGTPVSGAFRVEPAGLRLEKAATAELKFTPTADSRAWLASVVNITPTGVQELGNTRLDLRAGIADAPFRTLGTLAVVVPDPSAVVRVQRRGASLNVSATRADLLATGTDSLATDCGDPGNRCAGLSATASENLLSLVEEAAAVYPRITGRLRISGATASGEFNLATTIRVLLQSGASAESVDFEALIRPTATTVVTEDASEIRMTNVYFRIGAGNGSRTASRESVTTLVIPKGASNGSIAVTRTFQIRNAAQQLEDASVTLTFPAQFHQ